MCAERLSTTKIKKWVEALAHFIRSHPGGLQVPERLLALISQYDKIDYKPRHVFGGPTDPQSAELDPGAEAGPSRVHLFLEFLKLVAVPTEDFFAWAEERSTLVSPETQWSQLLLLGLDDKGLDRTRPLVAVLSKIKTWDARKRKMDQLRVLCVSNRSLSKPVEALERLSGALHRVINAQSGEEVLKELPLLLKTHELAKFERTGIPFSQLAKLLLLADNADNHAARNCKLLHDATIHLDVETLQNSAFQPSSISQVFLRHVWRDGGTDLTERCRV